MLDNWAKLDFSARVGHYRCIRFCVSNVYNGNAGQQRWCMFDVIEGMISRRERRLVFRFFIVFSRFEYALKAAGWRKEDREAKKKNKPEKADANWDEFSDELNVKFKPAKTPELQEAVDFLLNHPPRLQVINAGEVEFIDLPYSVKLSPLRRLLLYVRRVRNNMFHGGKFPLNGEDGDRRNALLLEHSLTVLEACSDLDEDVHHHLLHRA